MWVWGQQNHVYIPVKCKSTLQLPDLIKFLQTELFMFWRNKLNVLLILHEYHGFLYRQHKGAVRATVLKIYDCNPYDPISPSVVER